VDEGVVGVSGYLTHTPGLGGRIKASAEDFVVEEISVDLPRSEGGRYTAARVRTRNWETNRLVRELARTLHLSRKRIAFAGTKDRRAVTTQLLQFDGGPGLLDRLHLRDVEILDTFRTEKRLEIGDLLGNRFQVVVRDIPLARADIETRARAIADELRSAGGFPNFFGIQRFGSVRPITHVVGRHLVRGEIREAVHAYVGNPIEGEDPESHAVREDLEATGDYAAALRDYPREWGFESGVLFGSEAEFAAGRPGEIERGIVEAEGLRREDFVIPAIPRLSSRGTRRELLAPLRDLEWEAGEGTLALRFSLTPGCYGTSLLREFLKLPVA